MDLSLELLGLPEELVMVSGVRLWSLVLSETGLRLESGVFRLKSRGSEPDMEPRPEIEPSVTCPGHDLLQWAASMLRGWPVAFTEPWIYKSKIVF